jgi:hypothetical protein
MDADDPEKRIAELEHQLAERKSDADLPPVGASNSAPVQRRFVVNAVPSRWKFFTGYFLLLVLLGLVMVLTSYVWHSSHWPMVTSVIVVAVVGFPAFRRLLMKKIVICVTTDGLTVDQRPGELFSLRNATLGEWRENRFKIRSGGSALYLRSGAHGFVLGNQGGRSITSEVPVGRQLVTWFQLDAWTFPAVFDDLLAVIGSARRAG